MYGAETRPTKKTKKRDCSDDDVAMDMWSHEEIYNQNNNNNNPLFQT